MLVYNIIIAILTPFLLYFMYWSFGGNETPSMSRNSVLRIDDLGFSTSMRDSVNTAINFP